MEKIDKKKIAVVVAATAMFILSCFFTCPVQASSELSFTGKRLDYAEWVRQGYGGFYIDDGVDPDMQQSTFVNNVLLYLVFGDSVPAYNVSGKTAKQACRDLLFEIKAANLWDDEGNRRITDIADGYMLLRDKGLFTNSEQLDFETWFKDLAYEYRYSNKQYVGEALATVVAYTLDTGNYAENFSSDIDELYKQARQYINSIQLYNRLGFLQNSHHYNAYVIESRVTEILYVNKGEYRDDPNAKEALKFIADWLIDTTPHNGFYPGWSRSWSRGDHIFPVLSVLHGCAYVLNDGDAEHVKTAREAKWLATKMFEHALKQREMWLQKKPTKYPSMVETSPIWLWRFMDDSLTPAQPDITEHSSKVIRWRYSPPKQGIMGFSGDMNTPVKLVMRDGWEEDAFYLLLELAPTAGKNEAQANCLETFIYKDEVFATGTALDNSQIQGNGDIAWILNLANDIKAEDGVVQYFYDLGSYAASRSTAGSSWDRQIGFVKQAYAVVYDFTASPGILRWHLQDDTVEGPTWYDNDNYVELSRDGVQFNVYYPHNNWYSSIEHQDIFTWSDPDWRKRYWYSGDPSRELYLDGARTRVTVLYPYRGESPTVTAITPTQNSLPIYPDAVGVKIVAQNYTDIHGASQTTANILYDTIITDSEMFWARQTQNQGTISFVNGALFQLDLSAKPDRLTLDGAELTEDVDWTYSGGVLTVNPPESKGTLVFTILLSPPGDVNGNGVVDILDLQACVNVFLGTETRPDFIQRAKEVAEPKDECNVLDVQAIVNIILGV